MRLSALLNCIIIIISLLFPSRCSRAQCLRFEWFLLASEFEGLTFVDLLQSKGVDRELQNFLVHSIAMSDRDVSAAEALAALKKFTSSVGRFGDTPFLWPLYGSGEFPQAFCRYAILSTQAINVVSKNLIVVSVSHTWSLYAAIIFAQLDARSTPVFHFRFFMIVSPMSRKLSRMSAVFGGTYCLSQAISAIEMDADRRLSSVVVSDKAIRCKHLVAGLASTPKALLRTPLQTARISRAIFLTNKPLQSSEKDEVNAKLLL